MNQLRDFRGTKEGQGNVETELLNTGCISRTQWSMYLLDQVMEVLGDLNQKQDLGSKEHMMSNMLNLVHHSEKGVHLPKLKHLKD